MNLRRVFLSYLSLNPPYLIPKDGKRSYGTNEITSCSLDIKVKKQMVSNSSSYIGSFERCTAISFLDHALLDSGVSKLD